MAKKIESWGDVTAQKKADENGELINLRGRFPEEEILLQLASVQNRN